MTARRSSYSGQSRGPGGAQGFFIFVLLCIIGVQSYFLYKHHHPGKMTVFKKIVLPKRPVVTLTPAPKETETAVAPVTATPSKKRSGKIAIIIDDSGYNLQDCRYLKNIPYAITISILPDLEHSREISNCAVENNKEVMLHLPLEPHHNDEKYPDNYIIKTTMSPNMVIKQLKKDLANVPHLSGVNNHMGSKATETRQLMAIIFDELKLRHLFFVDSRVTTKSICKPLAKEKAIPFAERDVFLDNEGHREYIESQFKVLEDKAEKQGYAIAIGHARTLSWQVIKEQIEKLHQDGFELVTVDSIIKNFPQY